MDYSEWFQEFGYAGLQLCVLSGFAWRAGKFLAPLVQRYFEADADMRTGINESLKSMAHSSEKQTEIIGIIANEQGKKLSDIHSRLLSDD